VPFATFLSILILTLRLMLELYDVGMIQKIGILFRRHSQTDSKNF
jgi:hypothetical protein